MKKHLMMVVVLGLLAVTVSAQQDGNADKKKIQGLWQAVALEKNGKKAPDEVVSKFQVVIMGDKLVFNPDTENREATFVLDVKAKPKAMNLTAGDGPLKGKKQPYAIYKLEGRQAHDLP